MKRVELIEKLAEFYRTAPKDASPYHICDMLISYAQRIGGVMPTTLELNDSGLMTVKELLDYSELDYEIKWEEDIE